MGSPARKLPPDRTPESPFHAVPAEPGPERLLERRENSLLSLFELSGELSVLRDPFAMAQLTLLNAIGHCGANRAALWAFADAPDEPPVALCAFGLSPAQLTALTPWIAGASSGPVEPIALDEAAIAAGLGIAVPIASHDRRLGVMAIGTRLAGESYQGLDLEYLMTGGRMFGVALDHARLVHSMAESNRQLRRANAMLVEVEKLRTQFVQNVNHEMRTPITIVKGYLQALSGNADRIAFERHAIDAMLTQTDKLTRMVQDLLDYSALTERGVEMACTPIDAGALAERMANDRRPGVLAGYRAFAFLATPLPAAIADLPRLERVLDELIDNAIKFTPAGTRILLRTTHDEGASLPVSIAVEDDGPGIPADQIDAVFDPFRQGDGSSTRTAGGLGMGLALGRQMIERMGGRLEVVSEPGTRTVFSIRLRAA
jgi:signal transduction histidine kinase